MASRPNEVFEQISSEFVARLIVSDSDIYFAGTTAGVHPDCTFSSPNY
jgi:hypothetical protein